MFYKLLLGNETFHKFNRAALLGILFLSTVLPLIEISSAEQQHPEISENLMLMLQSAAVFSNSAGIEAVQQPETVTVMWLHLILLVYIAGIIFLPICNIYSIIKLYTLVRNGKRQTLENNITLIVHNRPVAPFSWFRYIVISEKDFEENGNEIILHEKAHIKKLHSTDLLICHIYNILQWINPVAWLFKRELQNIHEYEADEAVINEGVNIKQYQMLLIKKAVGAKLFALANNFNKCKLKKRIKMMSKNKSNPYLRLKYLYVLPILALVATAFASPQMKNEMEKISSVSISDLIAQNEMNENENANAADSINITVFNQDSTTESDTASAISFITISDRNNSDTIVISKRINNSDVLFIVDGEIVDSIDDIDANQIESVSVMKKGVKVKKDDSEKSGVVMIQTKTGKNKNKNSTFTYSSATSGKNNKFVYVTCDSLSDTYSFSFIIGDDIKKYADSLKNQTQHFQFYYNGVKFNADSMKNKLQNLQVYHNGVKFNTDSMNNYFRTIDWNIDSLKAKGYAFKFGDSDWDWTKANDGKLFYANSDSLKNWNTNLNFFGSGVLVIVDGKEMKMDEFAEMGSQIGKITVLKDKQAIEKYGMKAANGVIIIETEKK
jgi:TonB-dependent SusC/RagA subfamily outer membrane receptor